MLRGQGIGASPIFLSAIMADLGSDGTRRLAGGGAGIASLAARVAGPRDNRLTFINQSVAAGRAGPGGYLSPLVFHTAHMTPPSAMA